MSKLEITLDGHTFVVEIDGWAGNETELAARVEGEPVRVRLPESRGCAGEADWIIVNDRPYEIHIDDDLHWLQGAGGLFGLEIHDLNLTVRRPRSGDGRVKAPIPGQITRVMVQSGQTVEAGDPLMILEAMKMENEILAPRSGTLSSLHVAAGKGVTLGQVMAEIT